MGSKESASALPGASEPALRFAHVRAFNAVVEHRSFTDAARALGVSQPAITTQIRGLEMLVGGRLFMRGAAETTLTELGRSLTAPMRTLHHALTDAERSVLRAETLDSGVLSVGICGPYLLMPLIGAFAQRHPGVRLLTTFGNSESLIEGVREQRLDLAAVTLTDPASGLFSVLLATQQVVLAAPNDHRLASRGRIRLADLERERIITREEGSMTRRVFEEGLARAGVVAEPAFEFASREAVKEAVACGLGLGIVLDREFGCDSRLTMLTFEDASFTAGEYVVTTPALAGLGMVREFIALARQSAPEEGGDHDGHSINQSVMLKG